VHPDAAVGGMPGHQLGWSVPWMPTTPPRGRCPTGRAQESGSALIVAVVTGWAQRVNVRSLERVASSAPSTPTGAPRAAGRRCGADAAAAMPAATHSAPTASVHASARAGAGQPVGRRGKGAPGRAKWEPPSGFRRLTE